MIAHKIIFSGRVQGVGFRVTTYDLAKGFAVAGYVRNLDNGDVEMFVQGATAEVDRFVTALEARMSRNIIERSVSPEPIEDIRGFEIR